MSSSVILTLKDILLNERSVYTLDDLKKELGLTSDKSLMDFLLRLLKSEFEEINLDKMTYDETVAEIIYQYLAAFITEGRECNSDKVISKLNIIKTYIITQLQTAESINKSNDNSLSKFVVDFWRDMNGINNEVINLAKINSRYIGRSGDYRLLEDMVYNIKNLSLLQDVSLKYPKIFLVTNSDGELFFNELVEYFIAIIKAEGTNVSDIFYYEAVINTFLKNEEIVIDKKIKDSLAAAIEHLNHKKKMNKNDIVQRIIFLNHLRKKLMGEDNYVENQKELYDKYKANIIVPNMNNDEVTAYFNNLSNDYNDFTDKCVITIDPYGSLDLDDGISLEKLKNNNYLLGIYITDVSNYVSFNSYDDIEALKRGATVYCNDTAVMSMLPSDITIYRCSLLPCNKRKVVAYFMEIEPDGNVKNCYFARGIVKLRKMYHLTYFEADNILNKGGENNYLANKLNDMYTLSNLSFPSTFNVDPNATCEENGAHCIINKFSTLANYQIAKEMKKEDKPLLYRTHQIIPRKTFLRDNPNIANLIDELNSKMDNNIDRGLITSTFSRAQYSSTPLPHQQLGLEVYTHATSPLRRYPDLINQRLLKMFLIDKVDNDKLVYQIEDILKQIADSINSNQMNDEQYMYDYAHVLKK